MTRFPRGLLLVAALLFIASLAQADVIFALGTNPQSNEQTVNFTTGDSGHTVQGSTSNPSFLVDLYSANDPLRVVAVGSSAFGIQTDHGPGNDDTSVNDVSLSLAKGTFQDLIGSVYGVFAQKPTVDISVWTTDSSSPFSFSFLGNLANNGNEDNWFTLYATGGEQITKVLITGKFYQLGDLSISGMGTGSAPLPALEPKSMILLGAGILGAILLITRKK